MRILLTVHQFLPKYSAGTEILTLQVASELQRRGHQITVLTGHPTSEELPIEKRFDEYDYQGIKVIRFHHGAIPFDGQINATEMEYNSLFMASYFKKYLQELKPDVVHIFHLIRLSASVISACKQLGIPIFMTATDFWLVCPMNQLRLPDGELCQGPTLNSINCLRHVVEISQPETVKQRTRGTPDWLLHLVLLAIRFNIFPQRWFTEHVRALIMRPEFLKARVSDLDGLFVPTRLMESVLSRNGLEREKLVFLPYGLDLAHIQPSYHRGQSPTLRVGFIGTLYEHKGVHLLIDAVRNHLSTLDIELNVYGNTSEYPEYYQQLVAIASDDPRIHFRGTFPNAEIGQVLTELDVLVVPSIWYENTPLVVYSAQAAGCPVIGTDVGGIAEVIQHRRNGLLFEKGNVEALADAIRQLYGDRELLSVMSRAAKPPTTMQQYVDELEEVYSACLSQKSLP
ncbi:MAG TPA: glycosyltransferase family 4 protein [Phormidium sp.]